MVTTGKLVQQVRERLAGLQKERDRIDGEIAELKAAFSKDGPAPARARRVKAATKKRTSAANKKVSAASKRVWADVHKLHKAGKIAEPSRKARADYYKKHPKEAETAKA
jgi:hypothetical protein